MTMGVAERFYEAFTVRDHYTMGLLYAEHATFSDPVFPLLNARGVRTMWSMLLTRAEDLAIEVSILEDTPARARVDWVAHYTFSGTGRRVVNRIHTEMAIANGRIVRQVDTFSLWRWSRQALGPTGLLLGWSPIVRKRVQAQAARALAEFARKPNATASLQEKR
jgi:hypothetical protein